MLKYSITQIIASLPPSVQKEKRKEIRERLGLSPVMFSRYVHATLNGSLDLKGYQLLVIANILDCTVDDLYTKSKSNVLA